MQCNCVESPIIGEFLAVCGTHQKWANRCIEEAFRTAYVKSYKVEFEPSDAVEVTNLECAPVNLSHVLSGPKMGPLTGDGMDPCQCNHPRDYHIDESDSGWCTKPIGTCTFLSCGCTSFRSPEVTKKEVTLVTSDGAGIIEALRALPPADFKTLGIYERRALNRKTPGYSCIWCGLGHLGVDCPERDPALLDTK